MTSNSLVKIWTTVQYFGTPEWSAVLQYFQTTRWMVSMQLIASCVN